MRATAPFRITRHALQDRRTARRFLSFPLAILLCLSVCLSICLCLCLRLSLPFFPRVIHRLIKRACRDSLSPEPWQTVRRSTESTIGDFKVDRDRELRVDRRADYGILQIKQIRRRVSSISTEQYGNGMKCEINIHTMLLHLTALYERVPALSGKRNFAKHEEETRGKRVWKRRRERVKSGEI